MSNIATPESVRSDLLDLRGDIPADQKLIVIRHGRGDGHGYPLREILEGNRGFEINECGLSGLENLPGETISRVRLLVIGSFDDLISREGGNLEGTLALFQTLLPKIPKSAARVLLPYRVHSEATKRKIVQLVDNGDIDLFQDSPQPLGNYLDALCATISEAIRKRTELLTQ